MTTKGRRQKRKGQQPDEKQVLLPPRVDRRTPLHAKQLAGGGAERGDHVRPRAEAARVEQGHGERCRQRQGKRFPITRAENQCGANQQEEQYERAMQVDPQQAGNRQQPDRFRLPLFPAVECPQCQREQQISKNLRAHGPVAAGGQRRQQGQQAG